MLIPAGHNTKTITDMREDALGLLASVQRHGLTYIFNKSKPQAVILSIPQFQDLVSKIEDQQDVFLARQAEEKLADNKTEDLVPFDMTLKIANLSRKDLDD